MAHDARWLPVESIALTVPARPQTVRDTLQQAFRIRKNTSETVQIQMRGLRGIWFYMPVTLTTADNQASQLRGTIRPNAGLCGSLLVLLPVLKIVVVMSNPAELWPISLAFWPLLIAFGVWVLRQKQQFKEQVLHLPQVITRQTQITRGHAVQRTTATTPSAAAPRPAERSFPGA